MGLNFRKRVTILPGLTLNFGKRGTSVTVGKRGASMTFGKNGTYAKPTNWAKTYLSLFITV